MKIFKKMFFVAACTVIVLFWRGNVTVVEAANDTKLSALTFDAQYYYDKYPDLQAAFGFDENALYKHYLNYGLKEGRSGSAAFNCAVYKANYADLRKAFGNDDYAYCVHYETYGQNEHREAVVSLTANKSMGSFDASKGDVLGKSSTSYDGNESRATNIVVAAQLINGVVLQPGEEFSYNSIVMPTTAERGFVAGPAIYGGKIVMAMGGGICQVSSTLNLALTDAGMTATERHNHSIEQPYAARGTDAAVSEGYKDYRFKNTKDYAIKIVASADNENGKVTVSLVKAE